MPRQAIRYQILEFAGWCRGGCANRLSSRWAVGITAPTSRSITSPVNSGVCYDTTSRKSSDSAVDQGGTGVLPVWALTPHAQAGVFHGRDACAPCLALLTYRLHNSERWYEGPASAASDPIRIRGKRQSKSKYGAAAIALGTPDAAAHALQGLGDDREAEACAGDSRGIRSPVKWIAQK